MSPGSEWEEEDAGQSIAAQTLAVAMDPIGVVRRRWVWMLITFVLCCGAVTVLYFNLKPKFTAKASILVSSQQIPEEFVKSTVSGSDSLANINALMGEVVSQKMLASLIEKHNLYPKLRDTRPLSDIINTMRSAIYIDQQRNIRQGREREASSIFSISYTSTDPKLTTTIANSLADIFINASLEKRSEQARRTTEFLQRELSSTESDLREIKHEIAEFHRAHRGELPGDREALLRKLERLAMERQAMAAQIATAEDRLTLLQSGSEQVSNPESALMELRMELATQLAVHTDEHPNVIALRRRIERMQSELDDLTKLLEETTPSAVADNRALATKHEIENLRERIVLVVAEIEEIDARVARIPDNEEVLSTMEERSTVSRDNYLEFLRKVQDAELAETLESAQQGPRVSIMDRATAPTRPDASPAMIAWLGGVASLLLSLGAGVLVEILDPIVLSTDAFERVGAPPLLGAIRRLA